MQIHFFSLFTLGLGDENLSRILVNYFEVELKKVKNSVCLERF